MVARRRGSVLEIVRDGVTGVLGETDEDLVQAVRGCASLDRRACRAEFDARFTVNVMARRYVELYERLCRERHRPLRAALRRPTSLPVPIGREAAADS